MAKYIDLEANVKVSLSAEIAGKKPGTKFINSNDVSKIMDSKDDKDLNKDE